MYRYGHKRRTRRIYVLWTLAFILIGLAFYVNVASYNETEGIENETNKSLINKPVSPDRTLVPTSEEDKVDEVIVSADAIKKITPTTEIIYQYFYEKDDRMVEEKEFPPFYLINMNEEKLKAKFDEWEVIEFSSKRVVMRKTIEEKSPFYYIIGEKDGYVAVFYENPVNGIRLREITDTPISALPEEEQAKLKEGIKIYGEEELINTLEDYSS